MACDIGEASGRLPISCDFCHEVDVTVQLDLWEVPYWICRACALVVLSRFASAPAVSAEEEELAINVNRLRKELRHGV